MIGKIVTWVYNYFWDIVIGAFYTALFAVVLEVMDTLLTGPYIRTATPSVQSVAQGLYNAFLAYHNFTDKLGEITQYYDWWTTFLAGISLVGKRLVTGRYRVINHLMVERRGRMDFMDTKVR